MQTGKRIRDLGLTLPAGIEPRGRDAGLLARKLMTAAPAWELGATGPDAFDCWSMFQLVQHHLFGRKVLAVRLGEEAGVREVRKAVAAHPANAQWEAHDGAPRHGDAVKMGHLNNPFHIGVWLDIDRGMVLHHTEVTGVCCDSLAQLAARGFRKIGFHRWLGGGA